MTPHAAATRVSVVVACRNEMPGLRAFLDSVLHQDLGDIEMEVVIADGMSCDGTRAALLACQKNFPWIRIIDNPETIASTGLNRAIRQARGEIIVRMDAHSVYAPDYVRMCVALLASTGAQNVGGPARTRADGYLPQAIACGFHSAFACGGGKFRDPCYEGFVRTVPYGCWRRETLERVGLFDESLARGQDDELNFRIVASGGKVWQSPCIMSWYRPRTDLTALFQQFFLNGYWKVGAIRKHGRPPSWRNAVPTLCLLAGAGLPVLSATARLAGFVSWQRALLGLWATLVSLYAANSTVSAVSIAARRGWRYLPLLPFVFATYQFSYALGFFLALFLRPGTPKLTSPLRRTRFAANR